MEEDTDATVKRKQVDIAERQATEYASAIGQGVPQELIDNVKDQLETAVPPPIYDEHKGIPFVYEIIENEGWRENVLAVVKPWIADPANLERAGACVQRDIPKIELEKLKCGFCAFRLKETPMGAPTTWKPVREDTLGIHKNHKETVVFIALEDLGPANGFFMPLKYGQDVCVDSRADVFFPPTGGGKGICFMLKI